MDVCQWMTEQDNMHGDVEEHEQAGACTIVQMYGELEQTGDFRFNNPDEEEALSVNGGFKDRQDNRNQGKEMVEEYIETGGGGGAMDESDCHEHENKGLCLEDQRCHWSHHQCKFLGNHHLDGEEEEMADKQGWDSPPGGSPDDRNNHRGGFVQQAPNWRNNENNGFEGVMPHAAPRHHQAIDDDDHEIFDHHVVSHHGKTATGDALFFVLAIIGIVGLIGVAFTTACTSKFAVLGSALVDFWTAAAFYWIDCRLPYNVDHYEHAGLNYDAYAITVILVIIFAAARVYSAWTTIKSNGKEKTEFWERFDLLAIMGLVAQLTILCIHVITTKHASRTVICAFMGTVTSAVVQGWHLIQDAKSKQT